MSRIPQHKPSGIKAGLKRAGDLSRAPKIDGHKTPNGVQTRGTTRPPSSHDPDLGSEDELIGNSSTDSANIAKILVKLDTPDDKIESTKNHLSDRIDGSNAKAEETANECQKVKVVTSGLKQQLTVHGTRLGDLESKIEQLERERRKTSLVIDGVKEQDDEDVATTVADIFRDLGVDYGTLHQHLSKGT